MADQIWPTRQPDGTVIERHVYSGPQGEGFIDRVWRDNAGTLELQETHTGPEDRPGQTHSFTPVDESEGQKSVRLVISDRGEWTKDGQRLKDPLTIDVGNIDGSTVRTKVIRVPYTVNGRQFGQVFELVKGENLLTIQARAEENGFKSDPQVIQFTVTYIAPKDPNAAGRN